MHTRTHTHARTQVFQFPCCEGSPRSCVFVSENDLVCGTDSGTILQLDVRMTDRAVQISHSSSPITCLSPLSPQTCMAGYGAL